MANLLVIVNNTKYIQRDRETLTGFLKRVLADMPYYENKVIPVKRGKEDFGLLHYDEKKGAWFLGVDQGDNIMSLIDCEAIARKKEEEENKKFIVKESSEKTGKDEEASFCERGWYKK